MSRITQINIYERAGVEIVQTITIERTPEPRVAILLPAFYRPPEQSLPLLTLLGAVAPHRGYSTSSNLGCISNFSSNSSSNSSVCCPGAEIERRQARNGEFHPCCRRCGRWQ